MSKARSCGEPAAIFSPPDAGSETPWQGKLLPEALRGSFGAVPAIGWGEEMKRWAFAVKAKPRAARAVVVENMLAVLNECVRSVVEVVGMLRRGC